VCALLFFQIHHHTHARSHARLQARQVCWRACKGSPGMPPARLPSAHVLRGFARPRSLATAAGLPSTLPGLPPAATVEHSATWLRTNARPLGLVLGRPMSSFTPPPVTQHGAKSFASLLDAPDLQHVPESQLAELAEALNAELSPAPSAPSPPTDPRLGICHLAHACAHRLLDQGLRPPRTPVPRAHALCV
jgi:hypothetical protein